MRSWEYAVIVSGVLVFAIGVFLMVEGSILGERTTGIASLLGIAGCSTIAIGSMSAMLQKAKKSSKRT